MTGMNIQGMTQEPKSQGQEGGFTPAGPLAFKQSGGKPAFLTLRFCKLSYDSVLCASSEAGAGPLPDPEVL
jgi:hypothetical protein